MKATTVLIEEHGAVRVMLKVLEKINEKAQKGEEVSVNHLDQIIEFLQVFVDKCHHGKEEDVLFPEVKKLGIEDNDNLTQVLLTEHEQGRGYVKVLIVSLDKYKNGDKSSIAEIIKNGQAYIDLLNSHIDKENLSYFPRCDEVLTEEQQNKMYEEFEKIEIEKIGTGTHERLHKMIDELKSIYLQ